MGALMVLKDKVTSLVDLDNPRTREILPKVLLGTGLGLEIAAVVAGAKAARKQDVIIAQHEMEIARILKETEQGSKAQNTAIRKAYVKTGLRLAKNYGLTGGLVLASGGCFIGAHNIQSGTIATISAGYAGLREYIDQYEKRNIALNGEESHRMCKYGYTEQEKTVEDPESGDSSKVKIVTPNGAKEVSGTFTDAVLTFSRQTSALYKGQYTYDIITLEPAENYLNDMLESRGWVVVNDVCDLLGMKRLNDEGGRDNGWVKGCGERISLGFRNPINERFLQGYPDEPVILELNIHGNVNWLLKQKKEKGCVKNA